MNIKENCKCFKCKKVVDWIAEVDIYPQLTDSEISDYNIRVCFDCLINIHNDKEVKTRMEK